MADKQPMMIPVKIGLLNRNGEAVASIIRANARPKPCCC